MIENGKNVEIVKVKRFSDGTFGYELSNGKFHVGKYRYLKRLLKEKYAIYI